METSMRASTSFLSDEFLPRGLEEKAKDTILARTVQYIHLPQGEGGVQYRKLEIQKAFDGSGDR